MTDRSLLPPQGEPIPELKESLPKKQSTQWKIKELQREAIVEIENNPNQYDIEKLKRWKALGLNKPEWVTKSDWDEADRALSPMARIVCHLVACAMDLETVSSVTGCSTQYIMDVKASIHGKAEIARVQDHMWGDNFKEVVKAIIPHAIQTAFKLMMSEKVKAQTRVDAAFKFMDREMGKPTQQIEVHDNLLRSVFEKLDQTQGRVIPIKGLGDQEITELTENAISDTVKEQEEVVSSDPIDAWVKENL